MQRTWAPALMLAPILATATVSPTLAARLPECHGDYAVIRTSTIKPGKLDDFRKAVHDNQAWYTAHGLGDRVMLGQMVEKDAQGAYADSFSPTTVMTIHTNRSPTPPIHAPDDAQWNGFVAEYEASSDLISAEAVCLTAP
jgi:hypothetical protein